MIIKNHLLYTFVTGFGYAAGALSAIGIGAFFTRLMFFNTKSKYPTLHEVYEDDEDLEFHTFPEQDTIETVSEAPENELTFNPCE